MSNVIELVSFKLKEVVSEEQFFAASDKFNTDFLSIQNGYIERRLLKNEDTWTDIVLWETMDDAMNAIKAAEKANPEDMEYLYYIEESSCDLKHLDVAKSY